VQRQKKMLGMSNTLIARFSRPPGIAEPASLAQADGLPVRTGRSIRLLTVNIHKGYTALKRHFMLKELREAFRTQDSDLVFLQEVHGAQSTRQSALKHAIAVGSQYEYLADQTWQEHAYGRNAVVEGGDHGNAVLSRYPLMHWSNHDVSLPGDEARGLLHCVVQPLASAVPVHLFCVHLGLRETHRRQQLARLCELISSEVPADAPLIVAGDFNDWRLRADAALQGTGLVEVFRHSFGSHARSFPARLPLLRLDRIYVRGVRAAQPLPLPRLPWAGLSDHAPLAAEIIL
jgi:endonuclease/exonuclease/phosphatase family metal-dependent hydrolase